MVVASAVAVGGSALVLGAQSGSASSHREAPLTAADPQIDNTDTYAFVSPDNPETTTLIASWIPFQEPAGGPNFYPWATGDQARYTIKVDNNGDAVPDITYRWEFANIDMRPTVPYPNGEPPVDDGDPSNDPDGIPADGSFLYNNGVVESFNDPNLLFKQTYTLTAIDAAGVETVLLTDAPVAPSHVGVASMPEYQALRDEAVVPFDEGEGTAFAGQAEDSFFLDLRVFDLLYGGEGMPEVGFDTVSPYNVNSVALQVPTASLLNEATYAVTAEDGTVTQQQDPVIGVWSTTDRASVRTLGADGSLTASGPFVQVSRLGNPLVNEVVFPAPALKNAFNALPPAQDADVEDAVNKVLNPELPYVLNTIFGLPIKGTPRDDLFTIYLTGIETLNKPLTETLRPSEQLRLNTSVEVTPEGDRSNLGVLGGDNQGYPNGRRLTDDVLDIALQAVAGAVEVTERGGAPAAVEIVPALAAGDRVDSNQVAFSDTFPYLALPIPGSDVAPGTIAVPGPTVTETAAAAPAPTVTATATETVTAKAAPAPARGSGTMPRGGIDTGTADVGGASAADLALIGAAVVALGAGGFLALSLHRRREGSA